MGKKKIFDISGPKHLKDNVDWKNADHRRSAISSLVQGVYVLGSDPENTTKAQPWYQSFNFQLVEPLIKGDDQNMIFGAVYKYIDKYPEPDDSYVPRYVIAFRGMCINLKRPLTLINDVMTNFKLSLNKLEECSCFILAMNRVKRLVEENGAQNVWLAGHCLGSAIGLLVGKKLILEMQCFVTAYLFNPPFISVPIDHLLEDGKAKQIIRSGHRTVKKVLTFAAKRRSTNCQMKERFDLLSRWTPHLFVNPNDIFCEEYIAYFQRKVGAGASGRLAENNSFGNLFNYAVRGKDLKDATHLLPSAELIVNHSRPHGTPIDDICNFTSLRDAHGICQWWDPEVHCQSTRYDQSIPGQ